MTNDTFESEEVPSNYGYPSTYQPRPIVEQVARLRELFPELKEATYDASVAERPLPDGAEAYFASPRWKKIGRTYYTTVEKVLALIRQAHAGKFCNYRKGEIGPNRLRQHKRKAAMLRKLGSQQTEHDILVVPAQFGLRHGGRSVRRARAVMGASEFGLGAFAVGLMFLTHPERLQHNDDLYIDCAGDEYDDPEDDSRFSNAPYFGICGGEIVFGATWFADSSGGCGSASAFVL